MVATADSKALTVYERMPDPLIAINSLGTDIAKSGLFNCGSVEQGRVLAMECFARGLPPLSLAETYHIIDNKLSMKADKMLARFEEFGGKYKLKSRTPDLAEIELTIGGQSYTFSLSWDDAQREPFVYVGSEKENVALLTDNKKPKLKTKYATPRSRSQMLWARVVSDGVRAVCPRANSGTYTPEEIDDYAGDEAKAGRHNGNGHAEPRQSASVVDQAEAAAKAAATDAEFEVKRDAAAPVATPPATAAPSAPPADQLATDAQIKRIGELAEILGCGESLNAAYAKRGVASARSMKAADLQGIIDKLELAAAAKVKAAAAKEMPPCGPATDDQVAKAKQALEEFAQIDRKGYDQTLAELLLWLKQNGKSKIADMDANQVAQLYDSVRSKSLPTFIRADLEKYAAKGAAAEAAAAATEPKN